MTVGADYLEVIHVICILWVFEPFARFDVIYFNFAWMEWDSSTFAVEAIDCTNGSLEINYFIS